MRCAGKKMPHREDENRQCADRPDPQPARHVAQFAVVLRLAGRDGFWLLCQAAFRTFARMILLDLRVHRARVDRLRRSLPRRVALKRHAALRAVARLVRFHTGTHRANIFRRRGWRHIAVIMRAVATAIMLRNGRRLRFSAARMCFVFAIWIHGVRSSFIMR